MPRIPAILVLFMLIATGCARSSDGTWKAPLVYRVDVHQGNVVDQEMLDKLKPGMDKKQVKFIMGTPLITDTFHNNRWDYLYSFEAGGGEREQRRITLFFKEDKLDRIDGDVKVSDKPRVDDDMPKERTVAVPLEEDKPGIFKRMFSKDKDQKVIVEEDGMKSATAAPADKAAIDTQKDAATPETQEQPADASISKTDMAREPAATTTSAKDMSGEQSTAGNTQEKNLLRRFWDRMTKGGDEGDVETETEQDRRDAEVLEKAGGGL